jgi:hypothetical protein
VQEAYRIAASRVSYTGATKAQAKFKIDDHHTVSTINAARQLDTEGRGGGTRDSKKTHASKPRVHQDEDVDREEEAYELRECKICDGVLNYLTNGKKHFDHKCPFSSIATDHKKDILKSLSDVKELNKAAKKTVARDTTDDSDEDEEVSHGTIMGWGSR